MDVDTRWDGGREKRSENLRAGEMLYSCTESRQGTFRVEAHACAQEGEPTTADVPALDDALYFSLWSARFSAMDSFHCTFRAVSDWKVMDSFTAKTNAGCCPRRLDAGRQRRNRGGRDIKRDPGPIGRRLCRTGKWCPRFEALGTAQRWVSHSLSTAGWRVPKVPTEREVSR